MHGATGRYFNGENPSLTCSRNIDKFTVSSTVGNGALDYPVGLLTGDEVRLAGGAVDENTSYYLYTGQEYWLLSPGGVSNDFVYSFMVTSGGDLDFVGGAFGARPVIALRLGVSSSSGDGSVDNPYIVDGTYDESDAGVNLVDGGTFNSYIDDTTTAVVFTDAVVPEGATLIDLSKAGDGSVVAWVEETTMYVSSQVSGTKIIADDCYKMFYDKSNLVSIDLVMLDTSKVTDMAYMFYGCSLTSLNLSSFNTLNVTTMEGMFSWCSELINLNFGDNFDTLNVTDMYQMFYNCSSLTTLNLSRFDTSSVINMNSMFNGCSNLVTLKLGDNFGTLNVTDMRYMFQNCSNLTLDCSSWNVDKVTEYGNFNYNASGVTAPTWVN